MGFSVGSYAKIWEVEDKNGKYALVKLSVSQKNKTTQKYETTFNGKVAFFGKAYGCRPQEGQKIKITNCDVTNKAYVKPDGTKTYPFAFSVFEYELQEELGANTSSTTNTHTPTMYSLDDDEGDIPF